jgi:hypothetical protein
MPKLGSEKRFLSDFGYLEHMIIVMCQDRQPTSGKRTKCSALSIPTGPALRK